MQRLIVILVIFGLIVASYYLVTGYKDTYKILPAELPPEVEATQFDTWREFTSPSGRFSALFPFPPQHAREKVLDPKTNQYRIYDMYVSEKPNGTIFMVSLISFMKPIAPERVDTVLTSIMDDLLASNPKNQLKATNMGTFDNHKALDFTIENDEITIMGIAFMKQDTLYILTQITKNENKSEKEFKYFTDSFTMDDTQK